MNDWYSESYYSVSPDNNPQGTSTGMWRVVRGVSSRPMRLSEKIYSEKHMKGRGKSASNDDGKGRLQGSGRPGSDDREPVQVV